MASNPFFSGRIPKPLWEAIESYREQTNESKTDILIKALAQYIGYQLDENFPTVPPIQKTLEEIFQRLEYLEKNLQPKIQNKTEVPYQLEITSDNSMITEPNNIDDNNMITLDNRSQRLSAKELIKLIGVTESALSYWKNRKSFPKRKEGYIINYDYENSTPRHSIWIVKKDDNVDNN